MSLGAICHGGGCSRQETSVGVAAVGFGERPRVCGVWWEGEGGEGGEEGGWCGVVWGLVVCLVVWCGVCGGRGGGRRGGGGSVVWCGVVWCVWGRGGRGGGRGERRGKEGRECGVGGEAGGGGADQVLMTSVYPYDIAAHAPNYGGRVPVDTTPGPVPVYRALKSHPISSSPP